MSSSLFRGLHPARQPEREQTLVEVDFGAGPRRLPQNVVLLDLRPGFSDLAPASGPVDWSALDALPHLRCLDWSGPSRGIVDALAARPRIRFFAWHDTQEDIDLRATALVEFSLLGPAVTSVGLPDTIDTLRLHQPHAGLSVEALDAGHGIELELYFKQAEVTVPEGLQRVPRLRLTVGGQASAAGIAALTELRELTISFEGPPGVLADLAAYEHLEKLELEHAFGWDPAGLPGLPSLRELVLTGTRETTAATVWARFAGDIVTVQVNGAMPDAWLADHIGNPFSSWWYESPDFAAAACAAYNMALADAETEPEQAMRRLVGDLNAINDEYGLMGIWHRGMAWNAFVRLAERSGVHEAQASLWFDDGRRF